MLENLHKALLMCRFANKIGYAVDYNAHTIVFNNRWTFHVVETHSELIHVKNHIDGCCYEWKGYNANFIVKQVLQYVAGLEIEQDFQKRAAA